MYYARVVGEVVATSKSASLKGAKLLLIDPISESGKSTGAHRVAVDTVRAGISDLVACVGSREAALALDDTFAPVDDAIIGVVDAIG
jgi:ethanolamine utilization protein EutN